jgi:hypothetical protein
MKTLIILIVSIFLLSCTDNGRARAFGGKLHIDINSGEKVISASFKENGDLWYLVELPNGNTELREYSKYGIMSGKVEFH